jgi:ABC-type transport system substrate-binding protein
LVIVLGLLALFALSSVNLPANTRANANSSAASSSVLRLGEVSTPPVDSFNPLNPSCNTHLCSLFYDYPFALDFPPLQFITPRMIQSYVVNPANTVWNLTLRPNLKWSDGSSLNATDLAFSLSLYNQSGFFTTPNVTGITIVNPTTVEVNTQPGNFVLYDVIYNGFEILPKETFGQYNATSVSSFTDLSNIVSDGAFYITNYTSNQNPIILQANPYFWEGKPHFQTLYYYQFSSATAELNALKAGQIDMIGCGPGQCINVPGYSIIGPPLAIPGHTLGIEMNDWTYPFNITLVRQALAYATNVTQINYSVNGAFGPNASENQDLLLPAYNQAIGFSNGTGPVGYSYNITKAKQLFVQAGLKYSGSTLEYPNGTAVSFTVQYVSVKPWQTSTATILATQWAQVGINVQPISRELTTINSYATQPNPTGWQVLTIGVSPQLLNNWGVTPGPGIVQELGTYEVPVNGTMTYWNQTYAQVYHRLQNDAVNSSQYFSDAQQLAYMNAYDVPVIPLYNIFGYLIASNSISWGSPTARTGAYDTQSETSQVFWDGTLFQATPINATSTTSTTGGGGATTNTTSANGGVGGTTTVASSTGVGQVTTTSNKSFTAISFSYIAVIVIAIIVIAGMVMATIRKGGSRKTTTT